MDENTKMTFDGENLDLINLLARARSKASEEGSSYLADVVLNWEDGEFSWEEAFSYVEDVLGERWEVAPTKFSDPNPLRTYMKDRFPED